MTIPDKKNVREAVEDKTVRKHTIMLVEDSETQLNLYEEILSEEYNILKAKDGQEALETIEKMEKSKNTMPSLIISDQKMEVMNGVEFFKKIKEDIPETIRILFTAYFTRDFVIDAINSAQIYQFLSKPCSIDILKLSVKRGIEFFEKRKKLEESRITDFLTKLKNRLYVSEIIENDIDWVNSNYQNWPKDIAKPQCSHVAFLMLDIDYFKSVNDDYDHDAGNRVLKQFADILKKNTCEEDVVARWGGEEFLVINRSTDEERAMKLGECLREAVKDHSFDLGNNRKLKITCSIGIACYPFINNNPEKIEEINWQGIIDIADQALYLAKNSGRNCCVRLFSNSKTNPDKLLERMKFDIEKVIEHDKELCTELSHMVKEIVYHEKKWADYDKKADVLYINFNIPRKESDSQMIKDGILFRYQGDKLIGITIPDISQRS